jgi:hypothetical protein
VAVGDRARTGALPRISQDYVSRFYPLDGSVQVMQAELAAARRASAAHPLILLHRQQGADITHREYREVCYELPQVAERLAVMALYEGAPLAVGEPVPGRSSMVPSMTRRIRTVIEAFAPLIVHAVRLHHTGQAVHQDLPAGLLLAQNGAPLSRR